MSVWPFRFYSERELADIEAGVGEVLQAWTKHWFPAPRMRFDLRNVEGRGDEMNGAVAAAMGSRNKGLGLYSAGALVLSESPAALAAALVGLPADRLVSDNSIGGEDPAEAVLKEGYDGQIIDSMLRACLEDLIARIAGDGMISAAPLAGARKEDLELAARLLRGAGSVVVDLRCDGFGLQFLLSQSVLEAWLAPISVRRTGAVTPLLEGVVDRTVGLRAELGRTHLTIGELRGLAVGDVLRLDQSIETAPVLIADSGAEVARGRLGSRNEHKALQLF